MDLKKILAEISKHAHERKFALVESNCMVFSGYFYDEELGKYVYEQRRINAQHVTPPDYTMLDSFFDTLKCYAGGTIDYMKARLSRK